MKVLQKPEYRILTTLAAFAIEFFAINPPNLFGGRLKNKPWLRQGFSVPVSPPVFLIKTATFHVASISVSPQLRWGLF